MPRKPRPTVASIRACFDAMPENEKSITEVAMRFGLSSAEVIRALVRNDKEKPPSKPRKPRSPVHWSTLLPGYASKSGTTVPKRAHARLSPEQSDAMCRECIAEKLTQREIAQKYGISRPTLQNKLRAFRALSRTPSDPS